MRRRSRDATLLSAMLLASCARAPLLDVPSRDRLEALRAERRALEARLGDLLVRRDIGLGEAPRGGLTIGVPVSFTRSLVEQLATGFIGRVTLTLRDLDVSAQSSVDGKVLFRRRRLGEFTLDVRIRRVQGVLQPAAPTLDFQAERIGLRMPVKLSGGHGSARLRFRWDGQGLAGVACGDLDVTRDVTASVTPAVYRVKGAFDVTTEGGTILVNPRFADLVVQLHVTPTEATWQMLDELVDEQRLVCRTALRRVDLRAKLEAVLGEGFRVKVPGTLLKPMRFPAAIEQSLRFENATWEIQVDPVGLSLTEKRMWYGADIETERAEDSALLTAPERTSQPHRRQASTPR